MSIMVRKCLLLAAVIGINLMSAHGRWPMKNPTDFSVCVGKTTGEFYARNLEDMMDPNQNPCDNFYQFACGGLAKLNSVCANETSPENASELDANLKVIGILSNETYDEKLDNIPIIRNAKNIYQSCIKALEAPWDDFVLSSNKTSKKIGLEAAEGFGGWPVVKGDSWNPDAFDWTRTVVKLGNVSWWSDNFFPIGPSTSRVNEIIYIKEPRFGLAKEKLLSSVGLEDPEIAQFLESGVQLAVELGAQEAVAKNELTAVVKFQIELARLLSNTSMNTERKNVTLGDLSAHCPSYPWTEYVNHQFLPYLTIDPDEMLSVPYYDSINNLYEFINATDKRILANYVTWTTIVRVNKMIAMEDSVGHFVSVTNESPNAVTQCLGFLERKLPSSFKALFFHTSVIGQAGWRQIRKTAQSVVNNVQDQLIRMVHKASWLNRKTRANLKDKIHSIRTYYGYAPRLYNTTWIENNSRDLETSKDDFIRSSITLYAFRYKNELRELKRAGITDAVKNELFYTYHLNSQVLYEDREHWIAVPDPFLTAHNMDVSGPQHLNYGRLGTAVAIGLGLAVDPSRKGFHRNGGKNIFWSESDSTTHDQKVQCIENQYKRFFNLSMILSEDDGLLAPWDLAEVYGTKAAYAAYRSLAINKDKYQELHGKRYSPRQMFWINAASRMCSQQEPLNETWSELDATNLKDYEKPGEMRILGSFSNLKEFAEDFQCPGGSPMNPSSRCSIF